MWLISVEFTIQQLHLPFWLSISWVSYLLVILKVYSLYTWVVSNLIDNMLIYIVFYSDILLETVYEFWIYSTRQKQKKKTDDDYGLTPATAGIFLLEFLLRLVDLCRDVCVVLDVVAIGCPPEGLADCWTELTNLLAWSLARRRWLRVLPIVLAADIAPIPFITQIILPK